MKLQTSVRRCNMVRWLLDQVKALFHRTVWWEWWIGKDWKKIVYGLFQGTVPAVGWGNLIKARGKLGISCDRAEIRTGRPPYTSGDRQIGSGFAFQINKIQLRDLYTNNIVRFHVPMATIMKMAFFWDVEPCSFVDIVGRCFGGVYCIYHHALLMETVTTSETSVYIY